MNAPKPEEDAYYELQCYTLAHPSPEFVHQHIVDAWTAQKANEDTKPIALAFALVGLFLHVERGASGRAVQKVHMNLARHKQSWPALILPKERGVVTVSDVMLAEPGSDRDRAIDAWCESVWNAYDKSHAVIASWLLERGCV